MSGFEKKKSHKPLRIEVIIKKSKDIERFLDFKEKEEEGSNASAALTLIKKSLDVEFPAPETIGLS